MATTAHLSTEDPRPFLGLTAEVWATLATAAIAAAVTALVFIIRLEGKVHAQELRVTAIEQQHREAVAQFRDDLAYIRTRLDQAIDGGLR